MMDDEKSAIVMASRDRDRELLIPVADSGGDDASSKPSSSSSSSHHAGREVISRFLPLLQGFLIFDCAVFASLESDGNVGVLVLFVLLFSLRGGFRSYLRSPLTCISDCFGLELLLLPISAVILML